MRKRKPKRKSRSGFTLLEVTFSTAIFSVIGYTLVQALAMGGNSQTIINDVTSSNKWVREVHGLLSNEMKVSDEDHIATVTLVDGNSQLSFMHQVEVAGLQTWGVFDASLGATQVEQNRENWWIRYTAEEIPALAGGLELALVRQLIDDFGAIQATRILVRGIRPGEVEPAGFVATKVGDIWEIGISEEGRTVNQPGMRTKFHVRTRN